MRIYNNISAITSYGNLIKTDTAITKSLNRLSSGLRINSAADDAAGLSISEKMRNQIKGFSQATKNAQDGASMLQTAEGAMGQQHEILQRVRELALQSNNGSMGLTEKQTIQNEISELVTEINNIALNTKFNGMDLLKGTLGISTDAASTANGVGELLENATINVAGAEANTTYKFTNYTAGDGTLTLNQYDSTGTNIIASQTLTFEAGTTANDVKAGQTLNFDKLGIKMTFSAEVAAGTVDATESIITTDQSNIYQVGSEAGQTLSASISDMRTSSLGSSASALFALDGVDVVNQSFADNLAVIDQSISDISTQRSKVGAYINRLEYTTNNLQTSKENLQASESRIRDLDMADEMMTLTRNQILSQASTAMLAQANQRPQAVLQLLQG